MNHIKTRLGCGNDAITLLVVTRGEKEKSHMLHPKSASSLMNAALAQQENLLSSAKRIHNDFPFLECHLHSTKLRSLAGIVEGGSREDASRSVGRTKGPHTFRVDGATLELRSCSAPTHSGSGET